MWHSAGQAESRICGEMPLTTELLVRTKDLQSRCCCGYCRAPTRGTRRALGTQAPAMHWKGGEVPPPPLRPSLCPGTVSLTPSASFNGTCSQQ